MNDPVHRPPRDGPDDARILLGPAPAEGAHRAFAVGRTRLLVARRHGALVCIDDWCNHAGCLLSDGIVDEEEVICPCHHASFRLGDGALTSRPAICQDQDVHPVEEQEGQVYWIRRTDEA